jgi:ubiquinone/menaquinone biosynthesis C-methylase UbiE
VTAGQRFARLATDVSVRWPRLWPLFRPLIRRQFDKLAPQWDAMRTPESFAPFEAPLDALETPPRRIMDLGTGTGRAAFSLASRFPDAEVVGVDIAEEMLADARARMPSELEPRVRFESADAAKLPFEDGSFDLIVLANMIPFFDELARVTAPAGAVVIGFTAGPETPIYVEPARLREQLSTRGFSEFAEFSAGRGTSMLARKRTRM